MSESMIDLITSHGQKVALRGIRVRSCITSMGQRTTIEQTFVNLEPEAIEVTYTFPLPERAAVCGFEVITGERVLTGQIEESQKAAELYEAAIGRGDGAYNLRQHRTDVFSIDVGNLKPQQMALVRITYVSELEVIDGRTRIVYSTVVAPRYATATATDPLEALRDAHALNPPHLLKVPYGLSLELDVSLGRTLKSIESPSHAITCKNLPDEVYRVTLAAGLTETNREVVLNLDLAREQEPRTEAVVSSDGHTYLAVTFVPELEEAADLAPTETIFVLDCSGSMQGSSISQAKTALDLCLRNLMEGDVFNICRFGSTFEWMCPQPLPYSQQTLHQALAYVHGIEADLRGTQLHQPLESVFQNSPRIGSTRQIILLTDGQISNEPAVIALARRHRGQNRIFTFGIGPASSRHLVRGLADATRGAEEFITEGERIEDKVLRTFSRLATPSLTDLQVRWEGSDEVEQAPTEIPPVFDGDALTIYARCSSPSVPRRVDLKCMTPTGPLRWTLDVPTPSAAQHPLPVFWARRMIQSLDDADAGSPRGQQRCIDLSKRFGVLCAHTSFVAIEHRSVEERTNGFPATRRVPVQVPSGWHGILMEDSFAAPVEDFACLSDIEVSCTPVLRAVAGQSSRGLSDRARSLIRRMTGARTTDNTCSPTALTQVLSRQQADGSFDAPAQSREAAWTTAVEAAGRWLGQQFPLGGSPAPERVIATLATLALLQQAFASDQPIWKRAADKAIRYLARTLGLTHTALRTGITDMARNA